MKLLITGASGAIGRKIVSRLLQDHDVSLFGRDINGLSEIFPGVPCYSGDDLDSAMVGVDVVFHLAARNNDRPGTSEEFIEDNVTLTAMLAEAARKEKVSRFVFISTLRALNPRQSDRYGTSKRSAEDMLIGIKGLNLTILRLAYVDGLPLRGKLKGLSLLPTAMQKPILRLIACFRPTVSLDTLLQAANTALEGNGDLIEFVSDGQKDNRLYSFIKRILDLSCAIVLIIFFGWLMALVAVANWIFVGRPIIFRQQRLGLKGEPFTLFKFRTMNVETPHLGTHEVSSDVITPFGKYLRRTYVDELPQIINILRGDMSLVGPRPGLPTQEELAAEREKREVFDALPGITGLAQVSGIDMEDPDRIARKDAEYIARRSLLLDISIIIRTPVKLLGLGK